MLVIIAATYCIIGLLLYLLFFNSSVRRQDFYEWAIVVLMFFAWPMMLFMVLLEAYAILKNRKEIDNYFKNNPEKQ